MNYYIAAAALRAFSHNSATKSLYRWLGNKKKFRKFEHGYAIWILNEILRQNLPSDARILELGTGWMHAQSLYPSLLTDCEIHMFDVWDNRSFAAFKNALQQVGPYLDSKLNMSSDRPSEVASDLHTVLDFSEARWRIDVASKATSFDDAYKTLNMNYCVDAQGRLNYPDNYFDLIYSADVLEHIDRDAFEPSAEAWHRMLKPNGIFVAQVGLNDHLTNFDQSKPIKHYLQHSNSTWRRLLENDLQYINRMTASEMEMIISRKGFHIEIADRDMLPLCQLNVHDDYRWQSKEDLATHRFHLVARRQ